MAKKVNKKAKAAPKKAAKKVAKKPAKKATPKKAAKKTVKKVVANKPAKKASKPAAKKVVKKVAPKKQAPKAKDKKVTTAKKTVAKPSNKPAPKEKKPLKGKPIDAVAKKNKPVSAKKASKGKKRGGSDEEEEDVDVVDDYESNEDEDSFDGELDEAGLVDSGEGPVEDEEDDEEEPIRRGRGRRKKNEGKSGSSSRESYIRNRPIQVDLSKPLIKKSNENSPKPFVNTKDSRTRYSDKELAEFKELILVKLKEAQDDYELLKQTLSNEDNHGTDDTSPTFKLLEDGSDVMSKEETAQLAARQEKYIVNLKNALVRIENKSYGICRVTGKLIPKERLRSVPHATLGIDAKLNQDT